MTEERAPAALDIPGLIRRVRRKCDLSQRDLAGLIGVSNSVIGRLETGEVDPQVRVLHKLLCMAGLHFTLGDPEAPKAEPMRTDAARDRGLRRLPAHLDPQPYRDFQDIWRFCWQGHRRRGTKVGYEHRETRDLRRARDGRTPPDHPADTALQRPRPRPRPALQPEEMPPDCICPVECERWCVQKCNCQCEPIGLWGYSSFDEVLRSPPRDVAA